MFGWFRRKPSSYAVAIRDSMRDEPQRWHRGKSGDWLYHDGDVWGTAVDMSGRRFFTLGWWWPDRRVIREGIEAWIAWSVSKREVCDE